jgi:hypothetical protein
MLEASMDPLTLYLAKLIGAVCVVMAFAMVSRGPLFVETAKSMVADNRFIMIGGAIRVVSGLAIMIGHDVWTGGSLPVAVTLFGWLLFFSGVFLLFASPQSVAASVGAMKLETHLPVFAGTVGVVGLAFLIAGYLA